MHSKGFNGSWASKVVNHIKTYKSCQFQWNTKFVDCKSACNSFHLLLMHTKAVATILSNKNVLSRSLYQKKNDYITNQTNLNKEQVFF